MQELFSVYKIILKTKQFFVMTDFYNTLLDEKPFFDDKNQEIAEWKVGRVIIRIEKTLDKQTYQTNVAFAVENWKTTKKLLSDRGLEVGQVKMKEGKTFFEIIDPDKNTIGIIEI
jgi:hypothetical protein